MIDTALTAAQIARLTSICTGQPAGRVATKEAAVKRFLRALDERIGEHRAARDHRSILAAQGLETAIGELTAAMENADDEEAASEAMEAEAPAQDDPAPVAHGTATFETEAEADADARAKAERMAREIEDGTIQRSPKRLAMIAAAGIIPPAPDFSAETHKRFRGLLDQVKALVAARDIEGLAAIEIKAVSSSPKAIAAYRDAAIIAIRASA